MKAPRILFVDDEEHLRHAASQTLALADIDALITANPRIALDQITLDDFGVLVTDIRMPDIDGLAVLQEAMARDAEYPVIMITGHGDVDLAVRCMRDGAYDFIEKPFAPDMLVSAIKRALEKRTLTLENRSLRAALNSAPTSATCLMGPSEQAQKLKTKIAQWSKTDTDLLIAGPSGTGKEEAARAIHTQSGRSAFPFIVIDCAALPDALLEIELFGHEAGAFPGAMRQRFGKFETARGGTLYLDGIDALSTKARAKLVRAIETRTIMRLGSNDCIELNVRFIASDHTVNAGAESRDALSMLFGPAGLTMVPLGQRRQDIPALFAAMVARAAGKHDMPAPHVPQTVINALSMREWPGNLRQLRMTAERFVLALESAQTPTIDAKSGLSDMLENTEKALIAASLAANKGQLKPTYESLRISRKALYEKMLRYGLNRQDFSDN